MGALKKKPGRTGTMEACDSETIARRAFSDIAARFPSVQMVEDVGVPVEISIAIPAQPGCNQTVWLCLQNLNELHFSVGSFWLEWFPCTNPQRVDSYVDAVVGYLLGKYRVLEHYRCAKCVKAELQAPEGANWRTLGTWRTLHLPFPWRKTLKEIRNN
jgi:hypothetical protein